MFRSLLNWTLNIIYETGRNILGTVLHPYLTWKRLSHTGRLNSAWLALILFTNYFALREPIRWGNLYWFGITVERLSADNLSIWLRITGLRWLMAIFTYILMVGLLTLVANLLKFGSRLALNTFSSSFRQVLAVWAYSYLPTTLWFIMAAAAFAILPPPRQPTWLGLTFSLIFLTISTALLIWKGLLYFLTLRLILSLSLKQIFWATVIIIPITVLYAHVAYHLNLFKVPFI